VSDMISIKSAMGVSIAFLHSGGLMLPGGRRRLCLIKRLVRPEVAVPKRTVGVVRFSSSTALGQVGAISGNPQ
jgi:hypothetical protein